MVLVNAVELRGCAYFVFSKEGFGVYIETVLKQCSDTISKIENHYSFSPWILTQYIWPISGFGQTGFIGQSFFGQSTGRPGQFYYRKIPAIYCLQAVLLYSYSGTLKQT